MTTAAIDRKLADRYGRSRPGSRRARWVVIGLVAAARFGYVAWTPWSRAAGSVDYDTTGFVVHDAHRVTVTFQVTADPDTAFACAVEARDEEHGVVGGRVSEYAAEPTRSRAFSEDIPTTAEATTGLATSSWIP